MRFPVSDAGEFSAVDNPVIDRKVTSDGDGSLYVDAAEPVSLVLYTVDGAGFEHTRAAYKAMLRTEGLAAYGDSKGIAYLEMRVRYPGGEEIVSRGPAIPPSGTTDWTPGEAVLYSDRGVRPRRRDARSCRQRQGEGLDRRRGARHAAAQARLPLLGERGCLDSAHYIYLLPAGKT